MSKWDDNTSITLTLNEFDHIMWLLRQRIDEIESNPLNQNDEGAKQDVEFVESILTRIYDQTYDKIEDAITDILSGREG